MARAGFIPPSGKHDDTCEYVCNNVRPTCKHACSVCDRKKRDEGRS